MKTANIIVQDGRDGFELASVKIKSFLEIPGYKHKFILHPSNIYSKCWVVSEYSTGFEICRAYKTQEDAKQRAMERLDTYKNIFHDAITQAIQKLKDHNISYPINQ